MAELIARTRDDRDSIGGVVEVVARGLPAGWGDPTMAKLDALLGAAMLSIPATKGVEIGDGFAMAARHGSETNDVFEGGRFVTNHAGGIAGGISNGAEVVVQADGRRWLRWINPGSSYQCSNDPRAHFALVESFGSIDA